MQRIGVLTYFWMDNAGTFLQAYATLAAVQRRFPGARVEMIDCKNTPRRFRFWKRYVLPWRLLEGIRRYGIFKQHVAEYLPLSERGVVTRDYDEATRYIQSLNYDLVIVGSDTLWEVPPAYRAEGRMPIYWLPPRLTCRKVALAISANAVTCDDLDDAMRARMAESLAGFDLVGVRDDATWNLVRGLGIEDESRLERVPDPTFTLDVDYRHIESLLAAKRIDLSGPTVGVNLVDAVGRPLARHYKARGFRIVALNDVPYADWNPYALSPFAWAGVYRYFDAMVTERFHGTVFSLKNGTPVVTMEVNLPGHRTPDGLSKRYSVLKDFDLLGTNYLDAETMWNIERVIATVDSAMAGFDREAAARKVEEMRERFNRFLDRVARLFD